MILGHLPEFTAAQPVQPRIPDVRDGHLVVVEQGDDQGRSHARILRLALRGLVDRRVRLGDLFVQQLMRDELAAVYVNLVWNSLLQQLLQLGNDYRRGHAARHLARVVSPHAVASTTSPWSPSDAIESSLWDLTIPGSVQLATSSAPDKFMM